MNESAATKSEKEIIGIDLKSYRDNFTISLNDFIVDLQLMLDSVPPEFRDSATVHFDRLGGDYDCNQGELDIYYFRPKTAAEILADRRSEEAIRREREAYERATFERLKAKFGHSVSDPSVKPQ